MGLLGDGGTRWIQPLGSAGVLSGVSLCQLYPMRGEGRIARRSSIGVQMVYQYKLAHKYQSSQGLLAIWRVSTLTPGSKVVLSNHQNKTQNRLVALGFVLIKQLLDVRTFELSNPITARLRPDSARTDGCVVNVQVGEAGVEVVAVAVHAPTLVSARVLCHDLVHVEQLHAVLPDD